MRILRVGPVPRHAAFIMDGNRRFAKKQNVSKRVGHTLGFEKMKQVLQWCLELGVEAVTVFAFSIDNFKRTDDEVKTLMDLAATKLAEMVQEGDIVQQYGVRVRLVGNMSHVPDKVREVMREAERATAGNKKATLNVAFSYTSRDELVRSVTRMSLPVHQQPDLAPETVALRSEGGHEGSAMCSSSVTEHILSEHMDTASLPEVDLLVRTSGEHRFSDFLTWQGMHAHVCWQHTLWPELSMWELLSCVLHFQHSCNAQQKSRHRYLEQQLARQSLQDPHGSQKTHAPLDADPSRSQLTENSKSLSKRRWHGSKAVQLNCSTS